MASKSPNLIFVLKQPCSPLLSQSTRSAGLGRRLFSECKACATKASPVAKHELVKAAMKRLFTRRERETPWPQPHSTIYGIKGRVNGRNVFASAASETRFNIMSQSFAEECGLKVLPDVSGRRLPMVAGNNVQPKGKVMTRWTFDNEPESWIDVEFMVLETTSRSVILGADFLRQTRTLDVNWSRVRSTTTSAEDFSCTHILGDLPAHSITGSLDSSPVRAFVATGTEANLVSSEFIKTDEYREAKGRALWEEHSLKFIDGQRLPIEQTIVLKWRFGNERFDYRAEFVVCPDLPCDVVLGQQFLYGSGAFFRYADCMERDVPPSCIRSGIGSMPSFLLPFVARPSLAGGSRLAILAEVKRREAESHRISLMPTNDRQAAIAGEQTRRDQWNQGYRDHNEPSSTDSSDSSQSIASTSSEDEQLAVCTTSTTGSTICGEEIDNIDDDDVNRNSVDHP